MAEAPEKNLALDIVRITEAAALASAGSAGETKKPATAPPWMPCG